MEIRIKIDLSGDVREIRFSDGTFLDFQIVENDHGAGEIVMLKTDNSFFEKLVNKGDAINIDLNGDRLKVGKDTLMFVAPKF